MLVYNIVKPYLDIVILGLDSKRLFSPYNNIVIWNALQLGDLIDL